MAEYLSPGVYVEEYDSGATPMQGVSTSTAGFVGLAERGPIMGQPQLVTSFADYKRMYGGYLSEAGYGSNRFLPYAVEQFGPLAPEVLESWGVTDGPDIGNIVYNMIRVELLSASPEDSRSDFNSLPDIPGFLRRRFEEEARNIPVVKPPVIA